MKKHAISTICSQGFDQVLVSGYLDEELTQADAQKVRIHLEDCRECRVLFYDLRQLREAGRSTQFKIPPDEQWNEIPDGSFSRTARHAGWFLALVWLVFVLGFGLWQLAVSSEGFLLKIVVFGGISGFVLLFISVLTDRLRKRKTDRYSHINK